MKRVDRLQHVKKVAEAHTNLNVFAIVASLMEGSFIYDGGNVAAQKIIRLAHDEQQRQLKIYDQHVVEALK